MVVTKPRGGWHIHVIASSFLWFFLGEREGSFPGMVWLGQGANSFMALNFSCEIISEKIIFPYMCLVCPCHFFTYIRYLKIYFSLYNLLYNCGRQNSTVLLKISRTSSPSIHAPSNPWEYRFNRFYSHD